jgi:hypothetical protein
MPPRSRCSPGRVWPLCLSRANPLLQPLHTERIRPKIQTNACDGRIRNAIARIQRVRPYMM